MARIIATLAEWNAALGQCGCCNMPGHPEPRKECESLTGEWGCGDTEYSKAYEKWQAARDKWIEEHEHLEDPPPYPVEPPEVPEDYEDFDYGCWGQFTDPELQPDEEMPVLYTRKKTTSGGPAYKGIYQLYYGGALASGWLCLRELYEWESDEWVIGPVEIPYTGSMGAFADAPPIWADPYPCAPTSGVRYSFLGPGIGSNPLVFTPQSPPAPECLPDSYTEFSTYGRAQHSDTLAAVTCPTPALADMVWNNKVSCDVYTATISRSELSAALTKASIAAKAAAEIPETWPEEPEGGSCVAALYVTWPTYQDILVDDESGPGKHYPACEEGPAETEAGATATKVRYRLGIPEGYTRQNYEAHWDEVFFPTDYDSEDPESPQPVLLNAREWEWTTGQPEWSDWFVMDAPTTPGQTRVVNLRVVSYHSKYGTKPSLFGEAWAPEEEDEP